MLESQEESQFSKALNNLKQSKWLILAGMQLVLRVKAKLVNVSPNHYHNKKF